ncbi:hypothetical protein HK101_001481 [Irineochytrium annulatum]|nr:hypothetical protein HK101_001481 [Irineochytrium annulatum]
MMDSVELMAEVLDRLLPLLNAVVHSPHLPLGDALASALEFPTFLYTLSHDRPDDWDASIDADLQELANLLWRLLPPERKGPDAVAPVEADDIRARVAMQAVAVCGAIQARDRRLQGPRLTRAALGQTLNRSRLPMDVLRGVMSFMDWDTLRRTTGICAAWNDMARAERWSRRWRGGVVVSSWERLYVDYRLSVVNPFTRVSVIVATSAPDVHVKGFISLCAPALRELMVSYKWEPMDLHEVLGACVNVRALWIKPGACRSAKVEVGADVVFENRQLRSLELHEVRSPCWARYLHRAMQHWEVDSLTIMDWWDRLPLGWNSAPKIDPYCLKFVGASSDVIAAFLRSKPDVSSFELELEDVFECDASVAEALERVELYNLKIKAEKKLSDEFYEALRGVGEKKFGLLELSIPTTAGLFDHLFKQPFFCDLTVLNVVGDNIKDDIVAARKHLKSINELTVHGCEKVEELDLELCFERMKSLSKFHGIYKRPAPETKGWREEMMARHPHIEFTFEDICT